MGADISSGTGAGLIAFLDWTIEKSELGRAVASSLKTASRNVLSVENDWEALDLRSIDAEDLLRRFKIKSRGQYTDKSLTVYRQRFQQAVTMYLTYLDDGDWRPRHGRTAAASRNGAGRHGPGAIPRSEPVTPPPARQVIVQPSGPAPGGQGEGLVEYPFPIRLGLRARLLLPDDLTSAEADRLAAHIRTLALDASVG